MDFFVRLFHTLFPLTQEKLNDFVHYVGPGKFHVVVFLILFCETGLVVTPFLPGDSLLFTLGAIGVHEQAAFSLVGIFLLILAAAFLGDNTNYWLGRRLGPAVFRRKEETFAEQASAPSQIDYATPERKQTLLVRLTNEKHLRKAQAFYEKYGAKTIILARFVPIVRTFAPFVAGVGQMSYAKFLLYSVVGAVAWVGICISAGALFGQIPFIKKHFELVVIAIVVISVLPIGVEVLRARAHAKRDEKVGTPS